MGLLACSFLASMVLSACGPVQYISAVPGDASGAIAGAHHVGADKRAIYEITAAEEYVHKSRELAGYARFQSSVKFGEKAAASARKAQQLSVERTLPSEEGDSAPGPGKDGGGAR